MVDSPPDPPAATEAAGSADGEAGAALSRVQRENLVSFLIVASGDVEEDLRELAAISAHVDTMFSFYEILLIVGTAAAQTVADVRQRIAGIPNVRFIVAQAELSFDDLMYRGLSAAIGDYVITVHPGELPTERIDDLIGVCAAENRDLLRVRRRKGGRKGFETLHLTVAGRLLSALVGRRVEPLQARALCVSRGALARILEEPLLLRNFRLVQMGDQFNEGFLELDLEPRRTSISDLWKRARLVAQLMAGRTPQLLTSLAIVNLLFSLVGFLFGIYAICIWIFKSDIAEGWLSTSLLMSFFSTAIFGVLSAVCLGLTQIMQSSRRRGDSVLTREFGSSDLFSESPELNVEVKQGN